MGLIRNRIPKLCGPEKHTGKYYVFFRDVDGRAQKTRFTPDRTESDRLCRRRVVEHYDNAVIVPGDDQQDKCGFVPYPPL